MNKYDSIIFDIDGTLWNASGASAIGWTRGLKSLGVERHVSKVEIESVAGNVFKECVKIVLSDIDIPIGKLITVLNKYEIEAMKEIGGEFYSQVVDLIPELSKIHNLFLVSNCQEWYLNLFFDKSGLKKYFSDWDCYGRLEKTKTYNIRDIIQRNNLKAPVYIGDTLIDKNASGDNDISFIHARYGRKDIGAKNTIDSFAELLNL